MSFAKKRKFHKMKLTKNPDTRHEFNGMYAVGLGRLTRPTNMYIPGCPGNVVGSGAR